MKVSLPPSIALYLVGVLFSFGGLILIIGPMLFAPWLPALAVWLTLGAAMSLAGVGLCRTRPWAWYLALGIVVSGLGIVIWRLLANGAAEWPLVSGALVIDVIIILVLLGARPETMKAPAKGAKVGFP